MKKEFIVTLTVLLCVTTLLTALNGCGQQHKDKSDYTSRKDKSKTTQTETPDISEKPELDLVTPFQDYFIFSGGNEHGDVSLLYSDEDNGKVVFSFEAYYFIFSNEEDSLINIVFENEVVANMGFVFTPRNNLSKGDIIIVEPAIYSTEGFDFNEYELVSKEIVVPDLGDYITQETELTTDVLKKVVDKHLADDKSFPSYTIETLSVYVLDLKPGYTKDCIEAEKSDRAFVSIRVRTDNENREQFQIHRVSDFLYAEEEQDNVIYVDEGTVSYPYYNTFEEAEKALNEEYGTSCQITRIY